jgi:hypothetical protein
VKGRILKRINQWKLVHQEFSLALIGKEVADDRVERSLYQRALGSEIERNQTVIIAVVSPGKRSVIVVVNERPQSRPAFALAAGD